MSFGILSVGWTCSLDKRALYVNTVTYRGVTVNGVWIGEWVYRQLVHTTRKYQ
jgi:hypothetical protein